MTGSRGAGALCGCFKSPGNSSSWSWFSNKSQVWQRSGGSKINLIKESPLERHTRDPLKRSLIDSTSEVPQVLNPSHQKV